MSPQVSKEHFANALRELGHDPSQYAGQRLSLDGFLELYEIEPEAVLDAIDRKFIDAHYDYRQDTIWVDALDAAHFYYCVQAEASLYSPNT